MKKILAVIPVREKSSRLKNKNIKRLCGHELFLWTYQFAKETKLINNIIISTESKKILNIAKKYGYKNNYLRKKSLSKKNVRNIRTVIDVVNYEKKNLREYDYVLLLHCTSPIRVKNSLNNAIKNFYKSKCDSAVSVSQGIKKKDNFICEIKNNNLKIQENNFYKKKLHFFNAAIYITKPELLKKNFKFINKKIFPIVQSNVESVDINFLEDFKLAETLIKSKKINISIPKKI